jgi:hypothetical protein
VRPAEPISDMTRTQIGLAAVALVAVVLAVVLVTRNGSESSERDAVEQVMSDLQSASRDGDGQRICNEIFTPKLSDSVTRSAATGSCASEVKAKLFSPKARIEVQSIAVQDASNATATVEEANGNVSNVFLVKQDGRWRIRSVTPA